MCGFFFGGELEKLGVKSDEVVFFGLVSIIE